jgi:hypothetical protein
VRAARAESAGPFPNAGTGPAPIAGQRTLAERIALLFERRHRAARSNAHGDAIGLAERSATKVDDPSSSFEEQRITEHRAATASSAQSSDRVRTNDCAHCPARMESV